MELMHPACDFLPLSKLSFLSSVHTTWHLAALKSYCEEINSSKDGGTSLISPNILFAPCSHAVSLIFLSFQPLFYSPHFSPPMPLLHFLTSSLSLYHLLILSPIVLSPFHFFSFFFSFVLPLLPSLFRRMHISPGTTGNTTWSCQSCCIASDSRFPPGSERSFRRSAALKLGGAHLTSL